MRTVILAKKVSASSPLPSGEHLTAAEYLHRMGVPELPPCTAPFEIGYDCSTVEGHLDQSANLIEILKISMSCSIIADENATRSKIAAATSHAVPTVTGKGLFQIAVAQGQLEPYLDLCADFGVARVECVESLADQWMRPIQTVKMAHARGLEVQFELERQQGNTAETAEQVIDRGNRWLNAGAVQLVAEASDPERGAGFDSRRHFNPAYGDRLVRAFGIEMVAFAAPHPSIQFAILDHFGRDVHLCDVRLEDLLNVECFRRGLHAAALDSEQLHPGASQRDAVSRG